MTKSVSLRGGSWLNSPRSCRSAYRVLDDPGSVSSNVGFRVVCNVDQKPIERTPLRGGSWDDLPKHCRSAFRAQPHPDDRDVSFGFRVVCPAQQNLEK